MPKISTLINVPVSTIIWRGELSTNTQTEWKIASGGNEIFQKSTTVRREMKQG